MKARERGGGRVGARRRFNFIFSNIFLGPSEGETLIEIVRMKPPSPDIRLK